MGPVGQDLFNRLTMEVIMEQIIREAIVTAYFVSVGALIVIWTGTILALFRTRTLGFVDKRERLSRHSRERHLPTHDALNCDLCIEEHVCKHDVNPLCDCFREHMCEVHA